MRQKTQYKQGFLALSDVMSLSDVLSLVQLCAAAVFLLIIPGTLEAGVCWQPLIVHTTGIPGAPLVLPPAPAFVS